MYQTTANTIMIFVIVCCVLILVLVLFIAFIIYKYQQRQNHYFQNMEELKIIYDHAILESRIEMQEQTFQNISREIHDNIGQKLALAQMQLNTITYNTVEKTSDQISSVTAIISKIFDDLRDISRSLSSEIISQNGLIAAIEFELLQINKTANYDFQFNVNGDTSFLKDETELVLLRVIQEALHNVIKHAEASKINITLDYSKEVLKLLVSDNGKGFDCNGINLVGMGIKNIKKRIKLLKGDCVLESNYLTGTQFTILIPISL
jgi:signal transduction histidine kinase